MNEPFFREGKGAKGGKKKTKGGKKPAKGKGKKK